MLDKTFDPKKIEKTRYKQWSKSGAFAPDEKSNAQPFTIMMPPPNVTGSLHIGHALNHTLQDVLTRYHRMKGRKTLWQPGTDHAGIATQMVVERKLAEEGKPSRKEMGREKFLEHVWKWKEQSGGTIVKQLERLGTTPDWSRERFTMDDGLSKAVLKAFVALYEKGLIYKDNRLVNWDPKLETAISDLEVELREQKGHMWHIRYPIEGATEEFITVATTRPETMLGDTAVAVHPDDKRYKDIIGKSVILPITGRLIPIIADEYADPEKGSGAVKITPAHDFNDFEVGRRHDLPMINIFDRKAQIADIESIPESYHGLDRFDARKKVLAELEELELLVEVENIKHSVPYDEKTKSIIIEPFLTEQWFCDTPTLAKPAAQAVRDGRTKFIPQQYENMYFAWVDNQLPWCISRQLWWGHQIPAWYDEEGNVYVAENEAEAYKQALKSSSSRGSTAGSHAGEKDPAIKSQDDGNVEIKLTRDPDVLDTWFSSALWPFSTLGWPDKTPELDTYFPGDTLVTGFDIITFWVSRMMMFSLFLMDEVPFKEVYIHALVRDSKGQKMSKSKGNVMDPLDLIDQYGADALRFTLTAMAAQGRDIKLSEERVGGYKNFATKLWNASRYCEMNGCKAPENFNPGKISYTPNQWIIGELAKTKTELEQAIEAYRFNDAANIIYHFVWGTFCDWYLEFTKSAFSDVILSDSEGSEDSSASSQNDIKREVQETTGWVLEQILVLLNPFMPFITEELNEKLMAAQDLLITTDWPDYSKTLEKAGAAKTMDWLIRVISEIRSVRADMNIPAAAKIQLLIKDADSQTKDNIKTFDEILKRMARLETIELTDQTPGGSIQCLVDQTTYILPVADIIDLDAERARLQKQLAQLEDDIQKAMQKLSNKQFIENAPKEIIAENENRIAEAKSAKEKITAALKQLEAA